MSADGGEHYVHEVLPGPRGKHGFSAYEIAVARGFTGDVDTWRESLRGEPGHDGKTPTKGLDYRDGHDGKTPVKGVDYFDGEPGERGQRGFRGLKGKDASDGLNGWTALLAAVEDGERVILKVVDWFGGQGEKPETGVYLGPDGYVDRKEDATNIRGPRGEHAEASGGASNAGLRRFILQLISESGGGGSGLEILFGAAVPVDADGQDTQVYIRTTNGAHYKKTGGTWVLQYTPAAGGSGGDGSWTRPLLTGGS